VIGAETLSRITDWSDRSTAVLFADGAGAVVLGPSGAPGVLSTHLHADGQYRDLLYCGSGVSRGFGPKLAITMSGNEVFKVAVTKLGQAVDEALAANGLERSALDWLVPHQANIRIIQATARKLDMPMERVIVTVQEHGNTSAASVPLGLGAGALLAASRSPKKTPRTARRFPSVSRKWRLLRYRPLEHPVDLLIRRVTARLTGMGRSQRLVGGALRTAGSLSGRGGRTARRVSSALRARHITLSLRQLSLQIVNLCLDGLQIRTTCHSDHQRRGSRSFHNARALHTSPLWVVDSGCLDNRCDSGGQVPPSSPRASASNLPVGCNCERRDLSWPRNQPRWRSRGNSRQMLNGD
jgi:hypothetical protein